LSRYELPEQRKVPKKEKEKEAAKKPPLKKKAPQNPYISPAANLNTIGQQVTALTNNSPYMQQVQMQQMMSLVNMQQMMAQNMQFINENLSHNVEMSMKAQAEHTE